MKTLIRGATLVTLDSERRVLHADILVDGDIIRAIGPELRPERVDRTIEAKGLTVIPGLIQTHVHFCQTLFRGVADDMSLLEWLKTRIWPLEGNHDADSAYWSAMLSIGELLKGGTTTVVDMESVHHAGSAFQAMQDSGIRGVAGKTLMDTASPSPLLESTEHALDSSVYLLEKWHGKANGRIQYAFAPRFALSCTDELLREVAKLADHYRVMVHTHSSENPEEVQLVQELRGLPNVLYLQSVGIAGPRTLLAHCIHLTDEEVRVLADTRTRVLHCPSANLKLASGICDVGRLLDAGVEVSVGADGAPCNNNLDGFHEMRLASLLQKPKHGAAAMPARRALELMTLDGARAIGQQDRIGSLEVGKQADLAILDLRQLHTWPSTGDVYARIVYSARSSDVVMTLVAGQVVYDHGRLTTLDEGEVLHKSQAAAERLLQRAGLL